MFSLLMNDIFLNLNYYFMLVNCATHTKTQCAKDIFLNLNFYVMLSQLTSRSTQINSAPRNKTCHVYKRTYVFFGARRFRKFADKNEIFGTVGRHSPLPKYYLDKNKPYPFKNQHYLQLVYFFLNTVGVVNVLSYVN